MDLTLVEITQNVNLAYGNTVVLWGWTIAKDGQIIRDNYGHPTFFSTSRREEEKQLHELKQQSRRTPDDNTPGDVILLKSLGWKVLEK